MKKIFLLFILISLFNTVFSQNSNVKIMDLSVSKVQETDTTIENVTYNIKLKVNDIVNSTYIQVLFGTTSNVGDVLSQQINVVSSSGNYYLNNNGNQTIVNDYKCEFEIELTSQQDSLFQYLTVFVVDNTNQNTNQLFFNK